MSTRRLAATALPIGALLALAAPSPPARAGGASPYLPLNLSPSIERKVEAVLILGGQAVLTRPVPIARVELALPRACERDAKLCTEVRHYLDRYFQTSAVTEASVTLAAANHSKLQLPNRRGERVDSPLEASAVLEYRPFEHLLLSAGGVGYAGSGGRFNPDGTLLSFGDEFVQLDAGWRAQWLSPMTDSSMLISSNAPTMPSLTLSNQMPIGRLGFEYQVSFARMSYSDRILWRGGFTAGRPYLASFHAGIAPLPGWSFGANAIYQYGGGDRPNSFSRLFDSLFRRTVLGSGPNLTDTRFANREISLTSTYTFPAPTPIETYVEYAARDTFHGEIYRFHETSLSAGIHMPELFRRFDLTLEGSEWQEGWYTDYVWQSGMVEDGSVIGHWGASWRDFPVAAGARSGMARLAYELHSGNSVDLRYRALQNASYAAQNYRLAQMLSLEYDQPRNGYTRGLGLDVGRDEHGTGFVRLSGFLRLDGGREENAAPAVEEGGEDDDANDQNAQGSSVLSRLHLERFYDLGASGGNLDLSLGGFSAASEAAAPQRHTVFSPHLGIGLRRAISTHADLGVRAEIDDFDGLMVGLRIIDWRYRIGSHLAAGAFGGFARYSGPTPAQGYYYGAGVQWRDLWRHWSVSLDERFMNTLQRDKLLPSDQAAAQNGDPVEWYSMQAPTLYFSHDF